MKREHREYRRPYGGGDYALHRGEHGVYWHAGHGVTVRLAAAEREDLRVAADELAAEPECAGAAAG